MFVRVFSRPFRVLLIAGFAAGVLPCSVAQYAEFSLTPPLANPSSLAPSLTDNPQSAPVTTLAIDLLAPQRPFIYDPTGSSVSANSLDPAIYSSTLSSSSAETDTALRDASQTGQLSLYAPKAIGTALSFSGRAGAAGSLIGNNSDGAAGEPAAEADSSQGYDLEAGRDYRSSWGTSSSFGTQTAVSTWGGRTAQPSRSGLGLSASSGNLPVESALSSDSGSPVGSSPYSASRASLVGDRSLRSEYTRPTGLPNGRNEDWGAARPAMPQVGYPKGIRASLQNANRAAAAGKGGAAAPSDEAELFSTLSRRSDSFSRAYTFGESPFSSPVGSGDLTFLNPNIFSIELPSSSGQSARTRRSALQEGLDPTAGLETSANGYGIATHLRGAERGLGGTRKGKPRNPYLVDSEIGLGNP